MEKFNQQKYINDYNKQNYKSKNFRLKKDEMDYLINFISCQTKLSVNEFIKESVFEKIERIKQSK